MHAVATDVRQIAGYVHVQPHLPRCRIDPHERRDVVHERAHVEPAGVERVALEQTAHAVDDVARSLVVGADIGENGADFVEVRRWVLQEHLRRLGVPQNCCERLIDLVRQPRGELAHHRDTPRVRDLLPQELRLLLGLLARGDVAGGAPHQDRLASGVDLDTAPGRDPAGRAIRQQQPVFRLVSAFIEPATATRVNLPEAFAIVRVQPLQDGVEFAGALMVRRQTTLATSRSPRFRFARGPRSRGQNRWHRRPGSCAPRSRAARERAATRGARWPTPCVANTRSLHRSPPA